MLSTLDSKESFWPSLSELRPARSTALMWTNTSLPPSSGAMKPKPLVALNHLTVPVVIVSSPKMRQSAMRPHDLLAGLIRFQRCLGEGSRLGAVNKAERLFEWAAFTPLHPIKQAINRSRRCCPTPGAAARSAQPADLLLGHHALDVLGLALDAVARAAVRLDRQAGDDGVDASLLDGGAALRPLQLMVDVVIDRVVVGHRLSSR